MRSGGPACAGPRASLPVAVLAGAVVVRRAGGAGPAGHAVEIVRDRERVVDAVRLRLRHGLDRVRLETGGDDAHLAGAGAPVEAEVGAELRLRVAGRVGLVRREAELDLR